MQSLRFVLLLFFVIIDTDVTHGVCDDVHQSCEWVNWKEWGPCSRSCGGGTRTRNRSAECCLSGSMYLADLISCSLRCDVVSITSGQGGGDCGDVCYNGGEIVPDSSFDYGRRCSCTPLFTDTCCDARTCSWDNHYCWPGECQSEYASSCSCGLGFYRHTSTSETTCQLKSTNAPSIETCETRIRGPNGDMERAKSVSNSTACSELDDFYGKFQPRNVIYDIMTAFAVNTSSYNKPAFVHDSNFGVTDARLYVEVQHLSGTKSQVLDHVIFTGNLGSTYVKHTLPDNQTLTLASSTSQLSDGQWLCVNYEAKGGGYLRSIDLTQNTRTPSAPVPYSKTITTRRLCYRYDSSPPEHYKTDNTDNDEPLHISDIITRSPVITASFQGWKDPIPIGGNQLHASNIESYQITVKKVSASEDVPTVVTGMVYTQTVGSSTTSMQLNLTSETPTLYAIYLEVKDVASNVRQARRFVLFDNSSSIDVRSDKPFYVESASAQAKFSWQTHHNAICLNWTGHFVNKFYLENPLLNPVQADPSGLINGVYEQRTGQLPITGTPNIHGIVDFRFSWAVNTNNVTSEIKVPDFFGQHYCHRFNLQDGETYTLNIRAVDIASNSYIENRTVHIDRTVPHINNIWLVKDNVHRLFVHDRIDLSKMMLYFEALDPHSGIREVQWIFGTSDSGSELLNGSIGTEQDCPSINSDDHKCYCPDVGKCEFYQYTLPMNHLVAADKHIGDHNRNYFFTVKVTNHAMLSNIEHLDILVDDSPPEKGVVFEGPEGSADFDYTSDDSIIVHWHGFIDHESGIKFYKVALSDRCLTNDEMGSSESDDSILAYEEIPSTESSTRLPANFSGKVFSTVVAVNNAMDMSDPVCSDGITRDISAPELLNVTIQNGKWRDSIICLNSHVWLLDTDMQKLQLHDTSSCLSKCNTFSTAESFPAIVPTTTLETLDDEMSTFMCESLPIYSNVETIIYLPNDQIYLSWDVNDTGSQINEFYVGIGLDISEASSPSQMQYISTGRKTFFNKHHIGIGSAELFYIFLKAKNKAGLERILTIGPLLTDETPPLYRTIPEVTIDDSNIVVTWSNETFYDMEQAELIDQIFFQFGHDGVSVKPMMEWRHGTSTDCSDQATELCIKYPYKRLQPFDTEFGFDFHITLFVYNKAGHFLQIDTDKFRLPSNYPPGHAAVLDIDPEDKEQIADVNVHFTDSTLCSRWSGFRHHENITLQFAVGSNTQVDDVLPYQYIENLSFHCVNSSNFLPGHKYHILIRSNCSGGSTVSVSNGVTILAQAYVNSILQVQTGQYCKSSLHDTGYALNYQGDKLILNQTESLEIGKTYHIYVQDVLSLSIDKGNGYLKFRQNHNIGSYYVLQPFVHRPVIIITQGNYPVEKDMIRIIRCSSNLFLPIASQEVDAYWYFTTGQLFEVTFAVVLVDEDNNTYMTAGSVSSDHRSRLYEAKITTPHNIESGVQYRISVRPCVDRQCLEPILSEKFSFVSEPPTGDISVSDIKDKESCFYINVEWDSFRTESPLIFYQWTLSNDGSALKNVINWSTIENASMTHYQVSECMSIPHDMYKTLFACVRAYTEAEQHTTTCKELRQKSPGAYRTNVVYDMDTTSNGWTDIKGVITSSNLGEIYRLLHDSELDFGTSSSKIAGVVVYGTERTIDWFLMTRPEVPTSCKDSVGCLQSKRSETGFIEFDMNYITFNSIYYICAASNVTHIERELFTERLQELSICSDGFVLDDAPPVARKINVVNHNGYITDMLHIPVNWDAFIDNIDATKLGYTDSIKSYSMFVGSREGGDNIVGSTNVGTSQHFLSNLTGLSDGATVYFSVKGTDQAGLSTTVTSRELTIDMSPPRKGLIFLNHAYDTKYTTSEILNVRPIGFHDDESGVEKYEVAVGSAQNTDNVFPTTDFTEEYDVRLPLNLMYDGHVYYAINRAGLESVAVTSQLIYDSSPPTGGNVIDGDRTLKKNVDFQTDVHHIKSHWDGFDDAHSAIQSFSVGLGLSPYDDDVLQMIDVGLNKESMGLTVNDIYHHSFENISHALQISVNYCGYRFGRTIQKYRTHAINEIIWNGSFVPGQTYYTAVETCNKAGLCTKKTSNGIVLDNSPPIIGIVRIGSGSKHHRYIPRRSSIHIHWRGFEDPESGMDHFEACIGTKPGHCDIEPRFNCLLKSNIIKTGLTLTLLKSMYTTVYAYNKAGMYVEQSSDAFQVDDTPPLITAEPQFDLKHKGFQGLSVQWEPSLLSISWRFDDNESPIMDHTVTLKTHHEGHTPVEKVHLGNENNLTISLDGDKWLKSGDKYFVVVTACNAAEHCSMAQSKDLLIDSSPPHLGGFRPPLTWTTYMDENASDVTLTWYGFHDQESELAYYFISVSRTYSGNELSNGDIMVVHNASTDVQQATIKLNEKIKRDDLLILSVWVQNHAGLNSTTARVSANVLLTSHASTIDEGVLELEKHSCDVHFCNKDCTCGIVGKPCVVGGSIDNCTILNTTMALAYNYITVEVFGGLRPDPRQITASSACLSGNWRLSNINNPIIRFEWSMGLIGQPIGEGIFDLAKEIPWRDLGLRQEVVHCINSNQSIVHDREYVIYVRAWYSRDQSAIFKSSAIKVDQTASAVKRGKYIKDSNQGCQLDFDFIDWMDTITACWTDVFSEQQSAITHYVASLGTSPGADDIFNRQNVGLSTNLTLTNLTLTHGTGYFFSVTAFNSLGLHTSLSSDGFVVDMDTPTAGVVFNTKDHVNAAYQSSADSLSFAWHGFMDQFSGIRTYYVALIEEGNVNETRLAFKDVGLRNRYTFNNAHLEQGKRYIAAVKADDAAAHESIISFSPAVTIDTTPPKGFKCSEYQEILSDVTSCSTAGRYVISTNVNLNYTSFYQIAGVMTGAGTAELMIGKFQVSIPIKLAYNGSSIFDYTFMPFDSEDSIVSVNGLCQASTHVSIKLRRCTEKTNTEDSAIIVQQIAPTAIQIRWMIFDQESHIKTISVGYGTTPGGFQIKALSEVHRGNNGFAVVDVPHGVHVYVTVLAYNHAGLRSIFQAKPITMDRTAPLFTSTPVLAVENVTNTTYNAQISWSVTDNESEVKQCFCGLGTQQVSVDLHDYVLAQTTASCQLENISLSHGDTVYATVFCVNGVELTSQISSQPMQVSLEPPSADDAVITVVPLSDQSQTTFLTHQHVPIQSNLSCVQLQWSGFADVWGVEHFEYRLKHGQSPVIDWTYAGTQTMAIIDRLTLQSGSVYTAEVRAVNVGHHFSDAVQSDVLVLRTGPRLTGTSMQMTVVGQDMQLDWSEVFEIHKDAAVSYTLTIGSKTGYNDVTDAYVTTGTVFSFAIPSSTLISLQVNEVFIELTSVYATGMSTIYSTVYKLTQI